MRIALGCDHRGLKLREALVDYLAKELSHELILVGQDDGEAIDYPAVAAQVAQKVSSAEVERGILICGTGIGMCVVANKYPGIRAAPCHDLMTAELSRRHNDANILCLSGDMLGVQACQTMVRVWLDTAFEAGRHSSRIEKIKDIEAKIGTR